MPVNQDVKAEKMELRAGFKGSRRALDREKKIDYDAEIQSRVLALRSYASTDIIFTYISRDIEIETRGIIYAAWANGKRVAVPRCIPGTNDMDFYIIKSFDDREPSHYGLLEPKPEKCAKVTDHSHGLCVVPGLSFDAEGYRLGYGRGYYDRFLKGFNGVSVGLCYSAGVKWKLPRGEYDVPVDMIATERYLRYTQTDI